MFSLFLSLNTGKLIFSYFFSFLLISFIILTIFYRQLLFSFIFLFDFFSNILIDFYTLMIFLSLSILFDFFLNANISRSVWHVILDEVILLVVDGNLSVRHILFEGDLILNFSINYIAVITVFFLS